MAVELMVGAYKASSEIFAARMEENALREATAAGLQSVEKLIKLLSSSSSSSSSSSQNQHLHQTLQDHGTTQHTPAPNQQDSEEYREAADLAVHKFKKVISLLDRTRTGHARFRRAPLNPLPQEKKQAGLGTKPAHVSAFKRVYSSSSSSQIQRLPPLPHNSNPVHPPHPTPSLGMVKESSTTINFSSSPLTSYISSLTGDPHETSVQPSLSSSGFQITNLSQVSSAGKPPLSSSLKRKCNSLEDSKCGNGSSGRCHCPKRR